MTGDFTPSGFIRTGGGVTFEERSAQPSDFTAARGYSYAKTYAEQKDVFDVYYPDWQAFADCFVMRRAVIAVSGQQTCNTSSFHASDLKDYTDPGFQNIKNFRIPGSDRSSIPGGKYQLTNLSFSDAGNSMTTVTVSYQQYGEWKLIKLTAKTPSPGAGPEK